MAFDGLMLRAVVRDIDEKLTGGRVEKLYQPEKDEIHLLIRSNNQNYKLLITSAPSNPRIHITEINKENPIKAPMLCMFLRKHLIGCKLIGIEQAGFERIARLVFAGKNELGDTVTLALIVEIMGRHSNVILVDGDDKILESTKHVTDTMSSVRQILPGYRYIAPPPQEKLDPLAVDAEDVAKDLGASESNKGLAAYFSGRYVGISKGTAAEAAFRALGSCDTGVKFLSAEEDLRAAKEFLGLVGRAVRGLIEPAVLLDEEKEPQDMFPFPYMQFDPAAVRVFGSIAAMMDFYFNERDVVMRCRQRTQDLRKQLDILFERCCNKLSSQQEELLSAENADRYKLWGELLTANAWKLKRGMEKALVENYYTENADTIEIPLDIRRSPMENAQSCYKRYAKAKKAVVALTREIEKGKADQAYLESLLLSLDNCTAQSELAEVRDEMVKAGYMKKPTEKVQKLQASKPMEFVSSDGTLILAGKNNEQNDRLTLKTADWNNLWLHTKGIHGSHVIVRGESRELSERTIEEAACIAAYYSKARLSSNVPVDYCPVKNVKKPSGARPGMVIYERYSTLYANPDKALIEKLAKE